MEHHAKGSTRPILARERWGLNQFFGRFIEALDQKSRIHRNSLGHILMPLTVGTIENARFQFFIGETFLGPEKGRRTRRRSRYAPPVQPPKWPTPLTRPSARD